MLVAGDTSGRPNNDAINQRQAHSCCIGHAVSPVAVLLQGARGRQCQDTQAPTWRTEKAES